MNPTDNIPGRNPFKVPENYFEEVSRKIISGTADTRPAVVKTGLYRKLRPYLAVAASVAAFVLLSYGAIKLFLPGNRSATMPEISLQEFSESYLFDIDLLTLEEEAGSLTFYEDVPNVKSADIIDYLLLENINESEIYELL
jgi:hypothetical protein